jgi:uncharacterized membrane protein
MSDRAQALWDRLREAGIVWDAAPPATPPSSPWYVGAMLGAAGWIAAVCLLGFLGLAFKGIFDNRLASLLTGALLVGIAYGIFRSARRIAFLQQFGLATSLAGQALMGVGIYAILRREDGAFWLTMAAIEAGLAIALPNFLHRVWSGYAAAIALAIALASLRAPFVTTGVIAAVIALVWLKEIEWVRLGSTVRPIGYGLTLALLQVAATSAFAAPWLLGVRSAAVTPWLAPWMGELTSAAVLIVVVWKLLAQAGAQLPHRSAVGGLAMAVLIGAVSCKAPGISAALTVVLLGYAAGNRVLAGLGIAAMVAYVFAYYYSLEATLLFKSGLLAATGVALLAVRALLLKWSQTEHEVDHA